MKNLIDKLERDKGLTLQEFVVLLTSFNSIKDYLFEKSAAITKANFSNKIFIRGLIEFTNYCKNNCYYCGLRLDNNIARYRLSVDDILGCCAAGYELGFRTFVLQGGEDVFFTDEKLFDIIKQIKKTYPDCAITLSLGERSFDSYQKLFDAGADRYLLRHETATNEHYRKLHPDNMSLDNRKQCLYNLKKIGFQTGAGFMVGSPFQTLQNIAQDLLFLKELKPQMVGIGPFIANSSTPFADYPDGDVELTIFILALVRLMLPNALLPATTALATLDVDARKKAIKVGANVVMPNLSPISARENYTLYNNKAFRGLEAAEGKKALDEMLQSIGYVSVVDRGDYFLQ